MPLAWGISRRTSVVDMAKMELKSFGDRQSLYVRYLRDQAIV